MSKQGNALWTGDNNDPLIELDEVFGGNLGINFAVIDFRSADNNPPANYVKIKNSDLV